MGGLEAALPSLQQGIVDVGFMQETKITKGIHTRYGVGYAIWETQAEIRNRFGVAVVWRDKSGWKVEGISNYSPNMVSFLLTTVLQRWYVVGAYLPQNDAPTVARVDQVLGNVEKVVELILLGDFKVWLI